MPGFPEFTKAKPIHSSYHIFHKQCPHKLQEEETLEYRKKSLKNNQIQLAICTENSSKGGMFTLSSLPGVEI